MVQNGSAYCGFGLLTWHSNSMVKLNGITGVEENKTVKSGNSYSYEGPLLADSNNLYVTQGKNTPASFSLSAVSHNGNFPGCGGTYATLTAAGKLYHGPGHNTGNRTDHMTESTASSRSLTTRHDHLSRIIVSGSDQFKIVRDAVTASGANSWTQAMEKPVTMILGGGTLYVGARDKVIAIDTATGNVLKVLNVRGDAYSLALANGKLFASTTVGKVYCFE